MRVWVAHHTEDTVVEVTVSEAVKILNGEEVESMPGDVSIVNEFADPDEAGPDGEEIRVGTSVFKVRLKGDR